MNRQATEDAVNGLQAVAAGLGETDESCAVIKNAIIVLEKQQLDLEVFEGMGVLYEDEIARKDKAIAEQARKLETALARAVEVTRERDAAVADCAIFPCRTCCNREDGDMCHQCSCEGHRRTNHG